MFAEYLNIWFEEMSSKGLKQWRGKQIFLLVKPDETVQIGGPRAQPLKVYLSSNLTPGGREHTTFKYLNLTLDPSETLS